MREELTFHFEGALADRHKLNFYEAARFQYAASRLLVKLAQFRQNGRFVQKISSRSNFDINLSSNSEGSFNINVEDPGQAETDPQFVRIPLSDLVAFVGERVVGKLDADTIKDASVHHRSVVHEDNPEATEITSGLDKAVTEVMAGVTGISSFPPQSHNLIKRRAAELHRERRLSSEKSTISRIDFARSQKLIAMSAPLIGEMATALRRSANTLEVTSSAHGERQPVLFLDQAMAAEIETSTLDDEITPILGDIIQFNKDNGWGKVRIEEGSVLVSFSIPSDVLPLIKQTLIDTMKDDQVYLQAYFVRDKSLKLIRLIVVGILPTPRA